MLKRSLQLIVSTVSLLIPSVPLFAGAQRAVAPATSGQSDAMNAVYARVASELLPIEVRGVGVSFRHFIVHVQQQEVPEVAFVVERDIVGFQQFGPAHAVLIEPVGPSVWEQIARLPAGSSDDEVRSHVQMARHDFTEETCPAILEILTTAQGTTFRIGSWSGQEWHPVHTEARIKTSASTAKFDCTGDCFQSNMWSLPAFFLLKACAERTSPAK